MRPQIACRRSVVVAGLLAGVLTIFAVTAPAQDKGSVRFAYLRLGWSATEIVHQEKLLERRGWKVQWTVIDPIPGLINAFAAGHVDVIDMSTVLTARMYEQGLKVVIFGATTGPTTSILVPADSSIRDVGDLRGRRIGAIPGSAAFQEVNGYTRMLHNLDLTRDASLATGMTPPDVVSLVTKKEVDAAVLWHPTSDALLATGKYRVLTDQDTLWKRSAGKPTHPVMVLYVTSPDFARSHRELLRDINEAQREAVELWVRRPDVAGRAIAQVTGLPPDVVRLAMKNTKAMLHGLGDETVDSILEQLKIARQHGTILQSDVWLVPEKVRKVRQELCYLAR
jgi:ABC-type nitrate/sulfonate/bicarbonate transport system substrate-binding protein